jgi:hypothetical protein
VDRNNIEGLPFPNAQAYANYMGRVSEWGSDLEASVIAKKINRPLLLWIASTRRHGILLNFVPVERSKIKGTAHILHSGNHYSALIFQNGVEENYYLISLLAQSAQMFGRGSTNDEPMYVCPDIQSQAMKRNNDVVESTEVILQPNKKRRMMREVSNLSKEDLSKSFLSTLKTRSIFEDTLKTPFMTHLVTSLYEIKIFLSELRQMVAIRLREDQRNIERLGEVSSRVWGRSLVNAADC